MKIFGKEVFVGVVGGVALCGVMGGAAAGGQTHKVAKPETVVRAIGVYEWSGDMTKPVGSRLVPVTLFIDGKLQDAGEYMARPIPFALLNGNVYELQQAGVGKGMLDLAYAKHLVTVSTTDSSYDEGWFGYGAYKPEAPAKKTPALRASKQLATVTSANPDKPHLNVKDGDAGASGKSDSSASTADPDRPTMKRRTDDTASGASGGNSTASSTPAGDPDRPTMKRRTDDTASGASSGSASGSSTATSAPADDPDRPTMKRRTDDTGSDTASTKSDSSAPASDADRPTMRRKTDDSGSGTGSAADSSTNSTASTGGTSSDDPDRPTLKRRSPEEAKKAQKESNMSSVTGVGSLNDDPSRPTIHRGKPVSSMTAEDLPPLKGLPTDVHQMVAMSDAADRPQHDFARAWENDEERASVLAKMEAIARAQLAGYGKTPAASTASTAPTLKKAPATKARPAANTKKPAAAPVEPLLDEDLKGYTLSYGGAPTYVYQAHTAGGGEALRYVTVVAQADGVGELQTALKSVTDAAHLDRTPRLRMVDAVDVEASNRASLLFELREQSSRQFALYRVIGARSEQIFLTGTTP